MKVSQYYIGRHYSYRMEMLQRLLSVSGTLGVLIRLLVQRLKIRVLQASLAS